MDNQSWYPPRISPARGTIKPGGGPIFGKMLRSIERLGDLRGRRILVRSDLDVPLWGGRVEDDGRVRASLPTIQHLRERGARIVIGAHAGQPNGAVVPGLSLRPVGQRLSELLGTPVRVASDVLGDSARRTITELRDGEVCLLENLRFEAAETSRSAEVRRNLAVRLALLVDAYVGDDFGTVHRRHASVYDLPMLLPRAAGASISMELGVLRRLTEETTRPYVVVVGGAKVSDKLAVIERLITRADQILLGGAVAHTFVAAMGGQVGDSVVESDQMERVRACLAEARRREVRVVVPLDVIAADSFLADANVKAVPAGEIPAGWRGMDIGPATRSEFARIIGGAQTVLWNGSMGVFELATFAEGTRAVVRALAAAPGLTVVSGSGSVEAVHRLRFDNEMFGHVSTGGSASLEYLEGRSLPGLTVLEAPNS